jgi:hypothetical protein
MEGDPERGKGTARAIGEWGRAREAGAQGVRGRGDVGQHWLLLNYWIIQIRVV